MEACPRLCSTASIAAMGKELVDKIGEKRAKEVGKLVSSIATHGGGNGDKRKGDTMGGPPKRARLSKKEALCTLLTASAMMAIYLGIPMVVWPTVESLLVSKHLLPLLCGQNAVTHIAYEALSTTGLVDSCATVYAAYQKKVTALIASTVLAGTTVGVNLANPFSTYDFIYNLIMRNVIEGDDEDEGEAMDESGESGEGAAYEAVDPKGKGRMRGGKRRTRGRKSRTSRKQTKGHKKRKTKGHKERKSRRTRKH